jgi:hypothetical protein
VWVRQVSEDEDFDDPLVLLLSVFAEDASVDAVSVFFESSLGAGEDSPPDFPLDE